MVGNIVAKHPMLLCSLGMRKYVVFAVLCCFGLLVSVSAFAFTAEGAETNYEELCKDISYSGSGTHADPYRVSTLLELQCIELHDLDAHYIQVNNIDASDSVFLNDGLGFMPIGFSYSYSFDGSFDGQNYAISHLYSDIEQRGWNFGGLFGYVGENGVLSNIRLVQADVTAQDYVGLIAGRLEGKLINSHATGDVNGQRSVGGLVGIQTQEAQIIDSSANAHVLGMTDFSNYLGGLVGENSGSIHNSYAAGTISGNSYLGGLVGRNVNNGLISSSYATGDVSGNNYLGGLVGQNSNGIITSSYATGDIVGNNYLGGLAGQNSNNAEIANSYATGSISGNDYLGGITGSNNGAISLSYSNSQITGNSYLGGVIGQQSSNSILARSYADASITSNGQFSNYAGGLIGSNDGDIYFSYARGSVSGRNYVGGVTGRVGSNANIFASYAHSSVSGERYVGGLVGDNEGAISYAFSTGSVSGNQDVGGLVGRLGWNGVVHHSVYNSQTSGQSDTNKGTPMTTANMRSLSTFTNLGWSIADSGNCGQEIWCIHTSEYPVLNEAFLANLEPICTEITHEGSGTAADPYKVYDVFQLQCMRNNLTAHYRLMNDIDASVTQFWNGQKGFEAIGDSSNIFEGTFDGQGNNILHLHINRRYSSDQGLFGYLHQRGSLQNIHMIDATITGNHRVGSLVGLAEGHISYSSSSGAISGSSAGGLIGSMNSHSVVLGSHSTASVTSEGNNIGGLVGVINGGKVYYTYATGAVSGNRNVGGLVGQSSGTIETSYAAGRVTGQDDLGGLVGRNTGTVTQSVYDQQVSGRSDTGKGTPTATASMMDINTYTGLGWSIAQKGVEGENRWYIDAGNDYPKLNKDLSTSPNLKRLVTQAISPTTIDIVIEADKPFNISVNYGEDAPFSKRASRANYQTSHTIRISELEQDTTYYYYLNLCYEGFIEGLSECSEFGPFSFFMNNQLDISVDKTITPAEIYRYGAIDATATIELSLTLHDMFDSLLTLAPLDVVLVSDVSGSMRGDRIEQLKQASLSFVDQLSEDDRIGLVNYATEAHVEYPLTNDFEEVKKTIDRLGVGGMTAIGQGLQLARVLLLHESDESRERVIVLMSDGRHNQGSPFPSDEAEITRNAGITVHSIALGSGADQDLMRDIAEKGEGRYLFTPGPEQLTQLYRDIAYEVTDKRNAVSFIMKDTLARGIIDLEEYNPDPLVRRHNPDGSVTLIWERVSLERGEEKRVRFNISSDDLGTFSTGVFGGSYVEVLLPGGNKHHVFFPSVDVTVNRPLVRFVNATRGFPEGNSVVKYEVCNIHDQPATFSYDASADECSGFDVLSLSKSSSELAVDACTYVDVDVSLPFEGSCDRVRLDVTGPISSHAFGRIDDPAPYITLVEPFDDDVHRSFDTDAIFKYDVDYIGSLSSCRVILKNEAGDETVVYDDTPTVGSNSVLHSFVPQDAGVYTWHVECAPSGFEDRYVASKETWTLFVGFTPIMHCLTIIEPGYYFLGSDLDARYLGDDDSCIYVRANDVTINGRGYSIVGANRGRAIDTTYVYDNLIASGAWLTAYGGEIPGESPTYVMDQTYTNLHLYDLHIENLAYSIYGRGWNAAGQSSGSDGTTVVAVESQLTGDVELRGGNPEGRSGNLTYIADMINLDNLRLHLDGARLFLNYSTSFSDIGTYYSSPLYLTLMRNGIGSIAWTDAIDGNQISGMSQHITMEHNAVGIDTGALPALNSPATITLFNILAVENPVILRDGEICNANTVPACHALTPLTGDVVTFTVEALGTYTIQGENICLPGTHWDGNECIESRCMNVPDGAHLCPGDVLEPSTWHWSNPSNQAEIVASPSACSTQRNCQFYYIELDGICGSAHRVIFSEKPTSNLCSEGVAGTVQGRGPWTWTCTTPDEVANCYAGVTPTNCLSCN